MPESLHEIAARLQAEVDKLKKQRPASLRIGTLERVVNAVPAGDVQGTYAIRFTVPNSKNILVDVRVEGNVIQDIPLISVQERYRFYETYDLIDITDDTADTYIPEPHLPVPGDEIVVYWDGKNLYLAEPMIKIVRGSGLGVGG